jgi:arylformamidase
MVTMKKIIDISLLIHPDMPVWEGDEKPKIHTNQSLYDEGVIQTTQIQINVHTGTHIDAPRHFLADGNVAYMIDLEVLMGECQVVAIDPGQQLITREVLMEHGVTAAIERILFKTRNTALRLLHKKQFHTDYVGLDGSAAEYLVALGVKLVGIDYLSIAPYDDVWSAHNVLLNAGVVILEGLDLCEVEPGDYQLACLPMKIGSEDGLPVRAILSQ